MWRKLSDVIFWLGLSLGFGGLVVVGAIVAPSVFATASHAKLTMPGVDKPLDMSRQVGGEIFGDILSRFGWLEMGAMGLMLVGIIGWFLTHKHIRRSTWVIAILWAAAASLLGIDAGVVQPKVWTLRETVRQEAHLHASDGTPAAPASAWKAKDDFDNYHAWSEHLGQWRVYLMLGMMVAAAWRSLAESRGGGAYGHADRGDVIRQALRK